jgi:hypothetical protein
VASSKTKAFLEKENSESKCEIALSSKTVVSGKTCHIYSSLGYRLRVYESTNGEDGMEAIQEAPYKLKKHINNT